MSKYVDRAKELRPDGPFHYTCCSATLVPFAEDLGLPEETLRRLGTNFAGGERRGATCGAVAAGLMLLGLFGIDDPLITADYYNRLKANHDGYLDCADLLRINKEKGGAKKPHCDAMVFECVDLAETMLKEIGVLK